MSSNYGEQRVNSRFDTIESRNKNRLLKIVSAALLVFFSLHMIFTAQYAIYFLGEMLNWNYEILEKIMAFFQLSYYLFRISRIIAIILLGIVLWLLADKNRGLESNKLKMAALIANVSFIFDIGLRIVVFLTVYFIEDSTIQSFLLSYSELMFISLSFIIWIQIAKIVIGVEFKDLNQKKGYQTKMMIAPIINTVLILPMIIGLVLAFITSWGLLTYLFLQPLYGLIGIIGSIEFLRNGRKMIQEREMELSREQYETRMNERRGVTEDKQMLIIGVVVWIGYLLLVIVYNLFITIFPIFGSIGLMEIRLQNLLLEVTSIISFFFLLIVLIALLQLQRKITERKYRTYLNISCWLFLANMLMNLFYNVIFYVYFGIRQLTSQSFNQQFTLTLSTIFGVIGTLLIIGAVITIGLFLQKMKQEKGWETNLLVMPFVYIGVYAISNIAILVVQVVLKLSEDPTMILVANLVRIGLLVLEIGMVVELLIRVINIPDERLREITGELVIPETTEKYLAMEGI